MRLAALDGLQLILERLDATLHCRGRLGGCFLDQSAKDWHFGGRLVCNYQSDALRGFVEAGRGEGGFNPLGLVVLFALGMKLFDGVDGALGEGIKNEAADVGSASDRRRLNGVQRIDNLIVVFPIVVVVVIPFGVADGDGVFVGFEAGSAVDTADLLV